MRSTPNEFQPPGSGLLQEQGIRLTGRWAVGRMCTGRGALRGFRLPLLPRDGRAADSPQVRVNR